MNNISDSKEELCRQFVECNNYPKYILGRNPFAQSVLQVFSSKRFTINGIVDEFTTDEFFGGVPIVHSISKLSADAIVLSAALLNPVTVKRKLCGAGVRNIDYFSLLHFYPEFPIKQICFWEGFHNSFANRHNEYEAIYECLADKKSKDIYNRIIDFPVKLQY